MGPYPIRGTWLPSHVPLEGTEPYSDFLDHNRWPAVLGAQDPDSSPEPSVEWVGGAVHLTGGRIGTHGTKASMVVTWNPVVVPTMLPPR
jgi:hypothetical protein